MAEKKVLVNLNFNGNQIINVRAEVAPSAPANATAGRFYFNSTYQRLYIYTTPGGWKEVGVPDNAVTGSGLTADHVVLGDGNGTVKISAYTIGTSVPSNALFTDKKVGLNVAPSTNSNFPILFSRATYGQQGSTDEAYINQYVTYNPSTNTFEAKNINAQTTMKVGGYDVATKLYVDQQDAKINDRISSISGFGRYLSGWDMATGEPTSLPTTATYLLQSGDYFVISNIPSAGATKYKPNQSGTWQTDQPFAKTATNEDCVVGGYWKYDGSTWSYFAPESAVTFPSFTNTSKGAIQGYNHSGYVYHAEGDPEGRGKVAGWDNKADSAAEHTLTFTGDVSGSGMHNNNTSTTSITVTIENSAVTTVKINDGAVTEDKIAGNAVTYQKIAAKAIGIAILAAASQDYPEQPYWQSTGNSGEYKATITSVTRNGTVRLCEATGNSFNGAKEVDCVYQYNEDETGVYSCTVYINSATAPASYAYGFLCRKE